MTILLTGVAGFIGFHTAQALLARGERVIGLDNLNTYYDVGLKQARLAQLEAQPGFSFLQLDVSDRAAMEAVFAEHGDIDRIVHLAAQAGVRYSMIDPFAYVTSNVMGHLVVLECARKLKSLRHIVYASSSSVYGANTEMPFTEAERVDSPLSVYAATKRADELLSYSYWHLYRMPLSGLRFFTVYGPWGRPDMAYFGFARAICAGEPITLYDQGEVRRDFTYIDDIVAGILGCLDRPPESGAAPRLLNIGNHRSERVLDLVSLLESGLGRRAVIRFAERPAVDVAETFASIDAIGELTGFRPTTGLDVGVPKFLNWFKDFYGI